MNPLSTSTRLPLSGLDAVIESIARRKRKQVTRSRRLAWLLGGLFTIIAFELFWLAQPNFAREGLPYSFGAAASAMMAICLIPFMITGWPAPWTRSDYLQLPGSTDSQGNHRCVKCGGRGIFRSGAYRSSVVRARCSRCDYFLWVE